MGKRIIYTEGQQVGNFTFLRNTEEKSKKAVFKCFCGNEHTANLYAVRVMHTRSCGCLMYKKTTKTHGLSRTSIYSTWGNIKKRCYNKLNPKYAIYGGRGIAVCDKWVNSFENFYSDMGDRPTPKHSIDRIDVNGNYEPSNCRWATAKQQANNTRTNRTIQIGSVRMTMAQWGERINMDADLIWKRLKRGWDDKKAIYTPNPSIKKRVCAFKNTN